MDTERSINLVFITSSGKKKTITLSGSKSTDDVDPVDVLALSNFIIQKNPIELSQGDTFVGLDKAYIEEKQISNINMNI
ncbi:DUF2922 domain-containing protein [Proteocatella sphenisci]|uniref:DUF2922 domain-containing protein n=1 Tax=Proteocatella sphenisci TaxID=181070 RepID=UPI0004920D27|nr:DUF2922 domain-containing protein [Proteocatella sphenisci]